MSQERETNLALFIDFDNVALGARDAHQRFDINHVLERLLEKGKIIIKKAYADWSYYQDYMGDLHAAAIELIEVPSPRVSGKNSADIRLVVDAIDLCYNKEHVDAFVIVSGDSDFSPLVSKLRENAKSVIGIGMRNSSSKLLISNCDEFIFYDDLMQKSSVGGEMRLDDVPAEKRKLFSLLISTIQGLMLEHRGRLYSSLIKDTMKRKKPDFNEGNWGYSSFGDLLEDAMTLGLLQAHRDEQAGGTWIVASLAAATTAQRSGRSRSSRRRGRRRSGGASDETTVNTVTPGTSAAAPSESKSGPKTDSRAGREQSSSPAAMESTASGNTKKAVKKTVAAKAPAEKKTARKTAAKKTTKKAVKKAVATKAPAKKVAKKAAAKKTTRKTGADGSGSAD